ncbi:IPT/TIG domain-containing protein [Candidatus Daviesbacteria bacterium]|nr:IPT/TIG domain-containing protein [Candidatus Daviesbacteria bacterium]
MDQLKEFLTKKNLASLLVFGILILGIPLAVRLVQTQQLLQSKAGEDAIRFTGSTLDAGGNIVGDTPTVDIVLTSPFGPKVATTSTPTPTPSPSNWCGGIGGRQCPQGQECKLEGNFPDATGICVPASQKPSPPPADTSVYYPSRNGDSFVLYWGSFDPSQRAGIEANAGITWVNHAGLAAGQTLGAARSQGLTGSSYWPAYSFYNITDQSKYSQSRASLDQWRLPPEVQADSNKFILFWGSFDPSQRAGIEANAGITWVNHAGLAAGQTLGAARSQGLIGSSYFPAYAAYNISDEAKFVQNIASLRQFRSPKEFSSASCAQVATQAKSSKSGTTYTFTTPCDVPYGWQVVAGGSVNAQTSLLTQVGGLVNRLISWNFGNLGSPQVPASFEKPEVIQKAQAAQACAPQIASDLANGGYYWEASCGGPSCSQNSDCPQNTGDYAVEPSTSNWCYGFSNGNRCMMLKHVWAGVVQGFREPRNDPSVASQTITINGGLPTNENPYKFAPAGGYAPGNYTVHAENTTSHKYVGYTLCYNDIGCHSGSVTAGSTANVNLQRRQVNGLVTDYADLWWHYSDSPFPSVSNASCSSITGNYGAPQAGTVDFWLVQPENPSVPGMTSANIQIGSVKTDGQGNFNFNPQAGQNLAAVNSGQKLVVRAYSIGVDASGNKNGINNYAKVEVGPCGGGQTSAPPSTPPSAPPNTSIGTKSYKVAESLTGLATAAEQPYDNHPTTIAGFTFTNKSPGDKTIFVRFIAPNGQTVDAQKTIKYIGPNPTISGVACNLSPAGAGTVITVNGQNLGSSGGSLKLGGQTVTVTTWQPGKVVATFPQELQGSQSVDVTDSFGRQVSSSCTLDTSLLDLSVAMDCRPPGQQPTQVEVEVRKDQDGSVAVPKKNANVGSDGRVTDFQPKFEKGKVYNLFVKAVGSLRRKVPFTSQDGTTSLSQVSLPVGDLNKDGKINSLDYQQFVAQFGPKKSVSSAQVSTTSGDFNLDGVINSIDYACMRLNFSRSDENPTASSSAAVSSQ